MGLVTSILLLWFFGFWCYGIYHKFGTKHKGWVAWYSFIVCASLMIFDLLLYFRFLECLIPIINQYSLKPIDNGRDLFWNSFIIIGIDWGIDYNNSGLTLIALLLIFCYPMIYKFWSNGSRILFGGFNSYQKGMWHVFAPTKKPKKDDKVAKTPKKT